MDWWQKRATKRAAAAVQTDCDWPHAGDGTIDCMQKTSWSSTSLRTESFKSLRSSPKESNFHHTPGTSATFPLLPRPSLS